jgi:hypothetical protein
MSLSTMMMFNRRAVYFTNKHNVIYWMYSMYKRLPSKYFVSNNSMLLLGRQTNSMLPSVKLQCVCVCVYTYIRSRRVQKITMYLTTNNIAHNMGMIKGNAFSSSDVDAIRIFVWFRRSVQRRWTMRTCPWHNRRSHSFVDGHVFERCNFACLELSGMMPIQRMLIIVVEYRTMFIGWLFLDEKIFDELTECEIRQHVSNIAVSNDEQQRIKDDVTKLFDEQT